ncbi:MAG: C25 family cysteine peptidase [Verrucomicrobiia bacterium]
MKTIIKLFRWFSLVALFILTTAVFVGAGYLASVLWFPAGHALRVNSVAFSPDGTTVASSGADGAIQLWSSRNGARLRTLKGHAGWVMAVAFHPDGATLVSGGEDKTIRLWRAANGGSWRTLTGHVNAVSALAVSLDGRTLASGSLDRTVKLWRLPEGDLLRTLTGHDGYVNAVAFFRDGLTIASGSDDKTVKLWRVADGSQIGTFGPHEDFVAAVTLSADAGRLASGSGSRDKTVRVWRVADGTLERSWPASSNAVTALAFTPDGSILVSGGGRLDNAVRLWRAADGVLIRKLTGHFGSVLAVSLSTDGTRIASGSVDRTVRLWRLSDGALLWKTRSAMELSFWRWCCLSLLSAVLALLVVRVVVGVLRWLAGRLRRREHSDQPQVAVRCAGLGWGLLITLILAGQSRAVSASDVLDDRRAVVLGPAQELPALEVKMDFGGKKAPDIDLRSITLDFTVEPSECFVYAVPDRFEYLAVKDLRPCTQEGEPQVPMKTFVLELERDSEVCGVEVAEGSFARVQGEVTIAPSPRANEPNWGKLIPDETIYGRSTLFPGSLVRYERGCDNKRQHVFVRFFPLQYAPAKKEATLVTKATIRLYYKPGQTRAPLNGNPESGGMAGVTNRIVTTSAQFVIICPSVLQDQGQRLASFHKDKEDIHSAVVTTEAICAAYAPAEDPPFAGCKNRDAAGWKLFGGYDYALARQIIAFLRDQAAHPHLAHVTLLGDATLVPPSYYYYNHFCQSQTEYTDWMPTDCFYGSPDYDLVPNYHLGRLSVSDAAEALSVVEKIERWHEQAQADWLKKVYLVSGWDPTRFDWFRIGFFDGFRVTRLDDADDRAEKVYAEPAFTTAEIGFVFMGQHGSGGEAVFNSSMLTGVELMTYERHDRVPMVFAVSCDNGAFDLGLVKHRSLTHSFGESVLLSKAGGIAYFGFTRLGGGMHTEYYYKGQMVTTHLKYRPALIYYPFLAYRDGAITLGELHTKAVLRYIEDNDIAGDPLHQADILQHVLLGDAALKIPPCR